MTCDETKLLLAEYWSQSLGEAEELAFEAHIAGCDPCRGEAVREPFGEEGLHRSVQ